MRAAVFLCALYLGSFLLITPAHAQAPDTLDRDVVEEAKAIVADSIFARLRAGEVDSLATWVTDQLDASAMGRSRRQRISEFRSQFSVVTQQGPMSRFGPMGGYDLLQETALTGTDRYFRFTYMTYHQEAPLVWEFHFYVTPNGDPVLNYFEFTGDNPFDQVAPTTTSIDDGS